MGNIEELQAILYGRFRDDALINTLVPGGLHFKRFTGEQVVRPYAVYSIIHTENLFNSDLCAIQRYEFAISVWDQQQLQDQISDQLSAIYDWSQANINTQALRILKVEPMPTKVDLSSDRKLGQDVAYYARVWEIDIYGR